MNNPSQENGTGTGTAAINNARAAPAPARIQSAVSLFPFSREIAIRNSVAGRKR
jgi:hypothetical protein